MLSLRLTLGLLCALSTACAQFPSAPYPVTVTVDKRPYMTAVDLCFNWMGRPVEVMTPEMLANGLEERLYDTDGDKKPDLGTMSHPGADFPLYYMIDVDQDEIADYILIDTKGDGKCEDIKLYRDALAPPTTLGAVKSEESRGRAI